MVRWTLAYGDLIYDNGSYYKEITNNTQSFDQVKEHYNDPMKSPIYWMCHNTFERVLTKIFEK